MPKIVKPHAWLLNVSRHNPLSFIEHIARVSHRSEDAQTDNTTERFIKAVVLDHGDWSVVEHVSAAMEFIVDRGITHELVRHRMASYTQESTRFVNYEKKMPPSFVYPKPDVSCEHCLSGNEPFSTYVEPRRAPWEHRLDNGILAECVYDPVWLTVISACEDDYRNLLSIGWRPQEARSVLPNALAAKIVMTTNLRAWRHVFLMRTTREAHPQIRQVMDHALGLMQSVAPLLFDDIVPGARQADNMRLPH